MKDSVKKLIFLGSIALVIVAFYVINGLTQETDYHAKYEGYDLTHDTEGAVREGTYEKYLMEHVVSANPKKDIAIDVSQYEATGEVKVYPEYEGVKNALYTGENSEVTFTVNSPEAGYYYLHTDYIAVKSRGVSMERDVYINGELPYTNASKVVFPRLWVDGGEVRTDNRGNQIRPTQVETYAWQSAFFRDSRGYIVAPLSFYLNEGENKVTLKGVNEPMVISNLELRAVKDTVYYNDYAAAQDGAEATGEGLNFVGIVQGEDSTVRSEASLYAKYDRGSAATVPYDVFKTILNYTGGETWRTPGQWIQWDIEAPEDGYYNISVKGRQNYTRGSVSNRTLYIDGEIPFEEAREVAFAYSNDWEMKTLGDGEGNPYKFYLTKGTHTIRLEAALGQIGPILQQMEDSTFRLNQIYRTILVYTGASPDAYRDYHIETVYPAVMDAMELEYRRLYKIVDDTVAYTGQTAQNIASAQTLAKQLEKFIEKPERISAEFVNFKDNVTALGTAALNMSMSSLDVDYLVVSGTEAEIPDDSTNAFGKIWHELKSFVASFIVDYDSVGDVYEGEEEEVVKVWILTGRDQGTILKTMVDDTFTPNSGIKVNVEIVGADALLNAVLAGRGPNVVLSVGANIPVDYALRGASEDLTQFSDLNEVLKRFSKGSYEQYGLDGALYALPETQMFQIMFYRKDILDDLGLVPPKTWQEMIEMLPTIQCNNMSIGIPSAAGTSTLGAGGIPTTGAGPDLSMYFSLLYQYGGDMYNEKGTKTIIDNEAGVAAFKDYSEYFTDYGLPQIYDFSTRFRCGEMPIGIASYTLYNTLMVSAPEIRGLWDFTLIPGTERVDENGKTYIDQSDFITGSATMMIAGAEQSVKEKAWEFMKWWSSTESQVRFGREMEALLGASARYATANREAFNQLAWSASELKTLNEQWDKTFGIREVPGGYYTGRHVTNAIRRIIIEKEDPRETILDYARDINDEITKKRIEFNLPLE